ncbi:MAG: hypothetical protein H7833_06300 [Magnetococcus sp. DMHC-1]
MNDELEARVFRILPLAIPLLAGLFFDWAPMPMLVGLTAGATLFLFLRVPWRDWWLFGVKPLLVSMPDYARISRQLIDLANLSRRDGILALETITCDFPPMEAAKNHIVDGYSPEFLKLIMQRERHTVLEKVAAVQNATLHILLAWGVLVVFLGGHDLLLGGLAGLIRMAWCLFGITLPLVMLRGHFNGLIRDLGSLYDLVTDGMVGIQEGKNPFILEGALTAGQRFSWLVKGVHFDLSGREITPKTVEKKLAAYLAETHPRFRRVNATWPEANEDGSKPENSFRFRALVLMDDFHFQRLLREVSVEELITALQGADPDMVRKVFLNCSPRAGDRLLEELIWGRNLLEGGTLQAQQAIMKMARELETEGWIDIMGKGMTCLEETLENFLEVGCRAVAEAGQIILDIRWKSALGTLFKEDGSPATDGDRRAEQAMRWEIDAAFPAHRLHGEEHGIYHTDSDSPYLWAFDPIDGTWSYVNHETTACTALALLKGEKTLLGVVHNPFTNELFTASAKGAFVNGRPLPLVGVSKLADGVLNYQIPRQMEESIAPMLRMWKNRKVGKLISAGGSPIYAMAMVAQGTYAAFVMAPSSRTPYPWDLTAGTILIQQSGGLVTDLEGVPIDPLAHTGWLLAGSNAMLHDEALALLREYGVR